MRFVSIAAIVCEDERHRNGKGTITMEGAPVKIVDADINLGPFGRANRKDLEVVPI